MLKKLLMVWLAVFSGSICAQSNSTATYGTLEKRFVKPKLSAKDSLAFRAQGIQKAQTLFLQTNLYLQNSSNYSNQRYIAQKIPSLFYSPSTDSLALEKLKKTIASIQEEPNYTAPKFTWHTPPLGYFGRLQTTNTKPLLQLDLVLVKQAKKFGKTKKEVWQVFLANPLVLPN